MYKVGRGPQRKDCVLRVAPSSSTSAFHWCSWQPARNTAALAGWAVCTEYASSSRTDDLWPVVLRRPVPASRRSIWSAGRVQCLHTVRANAAGSFRVLCSKAESREKTSHTYNACEIFMAAAGARQFLLLGCFLLLVMLYAYMPVPPWTPPLPRCSSCQSGGGVDDNGGGAAEAQDDIPSFISCSRDSGVLLPEALPGPVVGDGVPWRCSSCLHMATTRCCSGEACGGDGDGRARGRARRLC